MKRLGSATLLLVLLGLAPAIPALAALAAAGECPMEEHTACSHEFSPQAKQQSSEMSCCPSDGLVISRMELHKGECCAVSSETANQEPLVLTRGSWSPHVAVRAASSTESFRQFSVAEDRPTDRCELLSASVPLFRLHDAWLI